MFWFCKGSADSSHINGWVINNAYFCVRIFLSKYHLTTLLAKKEWGQSTFVLCLC